MTLFINLLRVSLGILFVYTGLTKCINPYGFRTVVLSYGLLPPILALPAAIIVPWVEVLLGGMLITGFMVGIASLGLAILLAGFITILLLKYGQTLPYGCGCFTLRGKEETVDAKLIIRDLVILAATLTVAFVYLPWR
ncbi:MAG: MauE/DoxX family redox-associated membrane protein [Bacillota bacterium]